MDLIQKVEETYHQKFCVISVTRAIESLSVVVELEDNTHHTIEL
jgi:hypothetical protein